VTEGGSPPAVDLSTLPPGSTVLVVAGPDDQSTVVRRTLGDGADGVDTERLVAATTDRTVRDELPGVEFVDCTDATTGGTRADLQQVGVTICRLLDEADGSAVVATYGVDDLLGAVDVQTVYRFFHIVASTVDRTESFGVCCLDAARHEPKAMTMLERAFDYVGELGERPSSDSMSLSSVG
jgi:hypothetical protein